MVRPDTWLFLAVLAMAACSGPKPPPPTVVELTITAAPDLNPAPPDNRPSPVVVSLYELAAPNSFLDADFYRLSGGAAAALGKDLVAQDQFMMMPGATRSVVRELDPQTRFLGMTAAYRVIDQADWRALVPIPLNRTTPVQGRLDPLAVTLTPAGGGS